MESPLKAQRPLADWLGQTVRFVGYMETWKPHSSYTLCLLKNVKVRLYWDETNTQERPIDHLWFSMPEADRICDEKMERLTVYHGCGTVTEYQRSNNGTFDFGIQAHSMIDVSRLLWLSRQYPAGSRQTIKALEKCRSAILSGTAVTDWSRSVQALLEEVETRLDHCRKQRALQQQYLLLQIQQTRGLVSRDPVKFPSQHRAKTPGFAVK